MTAAQQLAMVIHGKALPRTARGKLVLACDVSGCPRLLRALTREETPVRLMLRASVLGWARVPKHPNVMLCPKHAEKYLP